MRASKWSNSTLQQTFLTCQARSSSSQEVSVPAHCHHNTASILMEEFKTGNTGLGFETLKVLAHHKPAHIFLAARTASKAQAAIESLQATVPDAKITHLPLDLTSLESVRTAAQSFKDQSQRLDVLMLNAGIMAVPAGTTKDGFEIQMGTNHFGHFLLTSLLLPTLQATAKLPETDVRVIILTSEAHNMARTGKILMLPTELEKCGAWIRYAYSKLANVLFARELAKRYPEITSVAVHPGIVSTDLFDASQKTNFLIKVCLAVAGSFRSTPEQGALNQLWAASVAKVDLTNGAYYKPVGVFARGSPCAQNAELALQFWDWSEEQIKEKDFA